MQTVSVAVTPKKSRTKSTSSGSAAGCTVPNNSTSGFTVVSTEMLHCPTTVTVGSTINKMQIMNMINNNNNNNNMNLTTSMSSSNNREVYSILVTGNMATRPVAPSMVKLSPVKQPQTTGLFSGPMTSSFHHQAPILVGCGMIQ